MENLVAPSMQFTTKNKERLVFSTYKGRFSISLFGPTRGQPPVFSKNLSTPDLIRFRKKLAAMSGMTPSTCQSLNCQRKRDGAMANEGKISFGKDDNGNCYLEFQFENSGSSRTVQVTTFAGGMLIPSDSQFNRAAATEDGVIALSYLIDKLLMTNFTLQSANGERLVLDGYNNRMSITVFGAERGSKPLLGQNLSTQDMLRFKDALGSIEGMPGGNQKALNISEYQQDGFKTVGSLCFGKTEEGQGYIELQKGNVIRFPVLSEFELVEPERETSPADNTAETLKAAMWWMENSLPNAIFVSGVPFNKRGGGGGGSSNNEAF